MSSIRELRNVTPENGGTQQSNSGGSGKSSVPVNNAINTGNTGTVFSIRQMRGRTIPKPNLSPLTQPDRLRTQAVVKPVSEQQMERQQARQRQNEVEQAASAVTAVGAALGVPAQEQAKFVQQGVGFLKSAEKTPKTAKAEPKPRGLTLDQYKHEINEAIAKGDWTDADALARSLSVEPFSDENDYTKAAAYYDDVFNRENLSNNGGIKNEAITTARYIIDLADRSQWEELFLYMQSPDSATAKKAIKDAFGIDADSEKSREGNYYGLAEQLQEAINTYGYDRLSDGASEYKTMLANNVFYRRAESTLQRAGENEASSAQMDSYVRAQTAYYILDVLSGKLGVEDNGIPTKEVLQNSTTKYLLDYLKDFCKVDLQGIDAENYRKMIRDAMAETSKKAKTMGGVLQKSGYDVEAVREYSKLVVQQGFEQERYAALEKWTRGMSERTEATSAYFKNAYNESMEKAKALQKAGQDVAAAREYAKAKAYGKMVNLAGLPEAAEYTAANVMTIPYRAYIDPITSLASVASLAGKGSDTNDPNSYTPKLGSVSGTDLIRSATSEALEKNTDWKIFGRNVASFLYNTGMSAVDSAVSALSFGNMSIFAMGTTAAGSEANNILSRGGSREQAFLGGIAAGVIEAVTEYVSVDKLLKNMGTVSSAKDWLKSVGQQMFTEGTEEMSSEVLNIIVDAVNMGNLSENSQAVKDYMANGFSYDEARTKVLYDNVGDVIESGLSGAISGGLTAGVTSAPGAIVGQRQKNAAKRIEAAAREIQQSASQQRQQTEQRAELVQENNPDSEVVKSHGTQLYLDKNAPLEVAEKAGEVLDGILSGEITSENITGKKADKLRLFEPYSAEIVSEALGVDIPKVTTAAQARAAVKNAVRAYEQRIKAVATQESNANNSVQQSVDTYSARNELAAQAQETASEAAVAAPETQAQTAAFPEAPNVVSKQQTAQELPAEQSATPVSEESSAAPSPEQTAGIASVKAAGQMDYKTFKYRMKTDKEFRSRYTTRETISLPAEARDTNAYELYNEQMRGFQAGQQRLSREDFGRRYRDLNETKKNAIDDTEIDLAYQEYLEARQEVAPTETGEQTAEAKQAAEDRVGLVENAYSEAVPQEVREAVDALAKQFGLQISYEDIGSDNGYYIPGTNRVVLDINPVRSAVDDAGRSAYLFTVAHEVGHYARENMSDEAWESFEAHAVAAMGGETAVSAKMQEADDDGNSIYNTEDLAREDVACDFLGKILSDKDALKQFCDAIRDKTVSQPAARGILGAIRKVLAKLAGNKAAKRSEASVQQSVAEGLELFAEDIEAGRKSVSEIADALAELAKQPRPLMNRKQAEAILAEAKKSNKEAVRKTSGTQSNIDNAADLTYNKNENGGDQNVSNRMDQGLAEGVPVRRIYDNRDAQARGNGRGHQGILRRNLSKSLSRAFNESGVVAAELYSFDGDRAAFSSALDAAREADAKNGWCVTPQSAEELSGKLTFMDDGSTIGFVLTDSGDIEGVFKNPEKNKTRRAMSGVMPQAIAAGGTKLDCYGTRLVRLYENYGFVPVARVEFNEKYANPGWDASKGKPDIFFMMHNGDSAETVVSKIGTYPHMSEEQLNSLPRYGKDGYDDAMTYRDGLLAERNNTSETPDADIRRSRKDRQNETARVPKLPTRQEAEEILRRSREEQKAREIAEEARRDVSRRAFIENAPARRKSAKNTQLEDLVAKHGAIPPGENPVRDVSVPNRTTADTKVRQTVRTALEAEVTPDSLVPVIEDSIVAGNFDYSEKKNAKTVEAANAWVNARKSADAAYEDWLSAKKNKLNADMIARGFILYNTFSTAANETKNSTERTDLQRKAIDILQDISVMGTVAGQTAQAIRLLKQQKPDAQYYALERAVSRLQSDINERFGEKGEAPNLEIDKDLASKWIKALREGETDLAYDYENMLHQQIAAQVPKSVSDYINAWRYLAMLGNPKTLLRNAIGNAAFTPIVILRDQIGAIGELFLPKEQRTKAFGWRRLSKEGRALLEYAAVDFENSDVQQMLSRRKYDDSNHNDRLGSTVAEARSTFKAPVLKQWQAGTRYLMEEMPLMGDNFYKGVHYKRAFAGAARARGYTAEDFRSGRVSQDEISALRTYAANQAMKATFNDANALSNAIRRMRSKNKAANVLIEGVLPFKGTPANVLVRAAEYSPVGFVKAITSDIYAVATGKITGQEYIERISQGVSGTIMAGLGWLLAGLGYIRVNADDDDEREGKQAYSLELFGKSITLDWLAPSSIPFFMGAEIHELLNGDGYESVADAIVDVSSDFFAPILEMSMLSGAKDLLDNFVYAYSDGADAGTIVGSLFVQPFFSYLGQFIPTILSQTANALEPNRTTTYVGDISGKAHRSFIRNVAKLTEKIPFVDWRQIDYVDEWGNTESNGNVLERFFNSFLNPAYVNDIVVTDADAESARLKETEGSDVAPEKRSTEITVSEYDEDGEKISSEKVKLNGDQYSKYQREYGQQYTLMAAALMASDYYDELSDSDKVKAFQEIESLADEYGKLAAGVGYVIAPGSSDNKLYTLTESGMPVAEAYAARLMYTQLNGDEGIKPVDKYERFRTWVFENDDWTGEEKTAVIDLFGKFSSGYVVSSETYDRLVSSNVIDASTASSITEGIRAIVPPAGSDEVSVYQKYDYILGRDDLTNEQKDAAIAAYMSETEKERFDVCAKSGVSATAYVTVMSTIHNLKPLEGRSAVTDGQKWEVCVNAVSSEKQQDALLDRYMDSNQAAKYDMARSAGVAPKLYVKYYNAKYTYGDKNGSWKQSEIQSWLDANVSSTSQKAVLWELANSGWKNNPYR